MIHLGLSDNNKCNCCNQFQISNGIMLTNSIDEDLKSNIFAFLGSNHYYHHLIIE